MKTVYKAANSIEAHLIVNLLAQNGIQSWVQGEYLQGAMGELPAMGLVRVSVPDDDFEQARQIIDEQER
jgi:hypothetical protein